MRFVAITPMRTDILADTSNVIILPESSIWSLGFEHYVIDNLGLFSQANPCVIYSLIDGGESVQMSKPFQVARFLFVGGTTGWVFQSITAMGPEGSSEQSSPGFTNPLYQDTTFTGGIGTTQYTLGKLVGALKSSGLIIS